MKKMNKRNAGFSLVELMVVVAIIGVLATIAVPNYMKFQAKAKQSNAKSELTGIYTAEKTFFTEYTTYHSNLPYIGYVPEGVSINTTNNCPQATPAGTAAPQRIYTTGFRASGTLTAAVGAMANNTPFTCGNTNMNLVTRYDSNVGGTAVALQAVAAAVLPSNIAFAAQAAGRLGSGTVLDEWYITQERALINNRSGI